MRFYSISIVFLLFIATPSTYAQDYTSLEIKIKEAPVQLLQELKNSITLPISAQNIADFDNIAKEQGYRADELKHKLQTLTRLYLNPSVKEAEKYRKTEALIALLGVIGTTTYDDSYLQMLTGRFIARSQHDYKQALPYYNQSLSLIENEQDLQSQLLKQLSHFHLGSLHRILRQDKPALLHLKMYRDTAYQIRDDYLIAHAESALGSFYNKRGQLSLALQHYSEALRLSNRQAQPYLKADLQLQLARLYRDLESWTEALQYAHNAEKGFKALKMDRLRSHCMTVMAMVHANQGLWNQAIDYYLNAQQLDYKDQNLMAQALNYHNLGEAYLNNGNIPTALEFLFKSNAIFVARKSDHYLVYNHLLIAEVSLADKDWQQAENHSQLALELAEKLSLTDEKIEALQYKSHALRGLNKYDEAFETLDKLIVLSQSAARVESDVPNYSSSILAEQKLKLEVNKLQNEQSKLSSQLDRSRILLITSIIFILLVSLIAVNQWRRKKSLIINLLHEKEHTILEPVSGLPGYQGFIQELQTKPRDLPHSIALLSLTGQLNADLSQGFQCNNSMNKLQLEALAQRFSGQVYLIRPGLFMLTIRESLTPDEIMLRCREAINEDYGDTCLHLGLLPLPLLMDPDIKLSTEVHYGAAQMSLAAAQSLGSDKDYYVAIKALNFAPSAVFSAPLYLHLEKGLVRGLLRVDTNGEKTDIIWPRWKSHKNIDLA